MRAVGCSFVERKLWKTPVRNSRETFSERLAQSFLLSVSSIHFDNVSFVCSFSALGLFRSLLLDVASTHHYTGNSMCLEQSTILRSCLDKNPKQFTYCCFWTLRKCPISQAPIPVSHHDFRQHLHLIKGCFLYILSNCDDGPATVHGGHTVIFCRISSWV